MSRAPRSLRMPRFARVIFALIMREMLTSYGKSSAGYLWAILEPVGAIAMLSIAFSLILKTPALGDSFPLFYATGYLPYMMYNTLQSKVTVCLRENTKLLFYPRVTYADAIIARFILVFATQLLVAFIVFAGLIWVQDVNQRIEVHLIFQALLIAAYLGLGIGVLNAVLIFIMPAWRNIWQIVTRPMFIISCIFYLFDTLPHWVQGILWFNPLVHLVGHTRVGFYSTYSGSYISLIYPTAIGTGCLLLGLVLLRRHAQELINN